MKNLKLNIALASFLSIGIYCPAALAFPIADSGEGVEVIVGSTDPVVATYQGNSASYSNDLYLMLDGSGNPGNDRKPENDKFIFNNHASPVGSTVDLGTFPIGTKLIFRMHVNDTGDDFFTGPASRNPDNHTHARVQGFWTPQDTLVSFEDLFGGAYDYNDLSYSFTNVRAKNIAINKAWITPTKVKQGEYINIYAQVSGSPSSIGEVSFLLGNTPVATLSDPDGDGTWFGQYQVVENIGYIKDTRVLVKNGSGKVIARWPGFTVTQ